MLNSERVMKEFVERSDRFCKSCKPIALKAVGKLLAKTKFDEKLHGECSDENLSAQTDSMFAGAKFQQLTGILCQTCRSKFASLLDGIVERSEKSEAQNLGFRTN